MAKTVSSAGLQEFIETGKPTHVYPNERKLALAAKLAEVDKPSASAPPPAAAPPPDAPPAEEGKADAEDAELEKDLPERTRKYIGKQRYERGKAQEEAAKARAELEESEKFSEHVFNQGESHRRRAEAAEARLKELEAAVPKAPAKPLEEPKEADFVTQDGQFRWEDYKKAMKEYHSKLAVEELTKKQLEEQTKRAQEAAQKIADEAVAKARAKYPDWDRVVPTSKVQLPTEALRFLAESDYGMDIAYLLATDAKQADKIRGLTPARAVAAMRDLETQFEKPLKPPAAEAPEAVQTTKPTGAPAPITPISTSGVGTVTTDPAKMDFKQLRAWHRQRRAEGLER